MSTVGGMTLRVLTVAQEGTRLCRRAAAGLELAAG
jgi:hypothetical protein